MGKKNSGTLSGGQNAEVCILAEDPSLEGRAEQLSRLLGLPVCRNPEAIGASFDLALVPEADGLSLFDGKMTLPGDFSHMLPRLMPGKLSSELLVRAAKLKSPGANPVAIDCTAGLGDDSLLLASMGYTVHLFEHDPITAELLDSALKKSVSPDSPRILYDAASRMFLHREDSLAFLYTLRGLPVRPKETAQDTDIAVHRERKSVTSPINSDSISYAPDLIYLDPMFPARKKSGLITKKLQILQMLESPCKDEDSLLDAAIRANPRRIVIKRPLRGPFLAGIKPAYSIKGKAIRYDCVVVRG